AVHVVARPGDDEVALGIGRNGRPAWGAAAVGGDAELAAVRHAGRVVALGINAIAGEVPRENAVPGDDKVAAGVRRDGWLRLVAIGRRVNAELAGLGGAGGVVALGVDAVTGAVLIVALPCDDEIAAG